MAAFEVQHNHHVRAQNSRMVVRAGTRLALRARQAGGLLLALTVAFEVQRKQSCSRADFTYDCLVKNRDGHADMARHMKQASKQAGRPSSRQAETQTCKHADTQARRHTGTRASRQASRQAARMGNVVTGKLQTVAAMMQTAAARMQTVAARMHIAAAVMQTVAARMQTVAAWMQTVASMM